MRAATATKPASGVASLAVLPLVDLSSDGTDGGFFARGMHEDILAQLSRIPSLKLISRTSVMTYEGTTKSDSRDRRRARCRARARRQRAAFSDTRPRHGPADPSDTDEHVWAEQFDAELQDVFEVQTRIATAIARALERELSSNGVPEKARGLAVVPAAYDAYQKARDLHRNLDTADRRTFDEAQRLYEEARRLDERFASAWLQLAILHAEARWFGLDRSPERVDQARRCLEQARRRASPADQLALAEGIFAYYVDQDYGKALLYFDDAARLAPGNPEASFYRAMILRRRGELAACPRRGEGRPRARPAESRLSRRVRPHARARRRARARARRAAGDPRARPGTAPRTGPEMAARSRARRPA